MSSTTRCGAVDVSRCSAAVNVLLYFAVFYSDTCQVCTTVSDANATGIFKAFRKFRVSMC